MDCGVRNSNNNQYHMSQLEEQVQKLVGSAKYFQLSASWCPDCQYANSVWARYNVQDKIKVFDIGSLPKKEQEAWRVAFQKVTGSRNLPTIYVDGKFWATESELHRHENKKQLEAELKKIGLL